MDRMMLGGVVKVVGGSSSRSGGFRGLNRRKLQGRRFVITLPDKWSRDSLIPSPITSNGDRSHLIPIYLSNFKS